MNTRCFLIFAYLLLFSAVSRVCAQPFKSEGDFKKYFTEHSSGLEPIEGLWTVTTSQNFYSFDTLYDTKSFTQTVAVIELDSIFLSYDMKGDPYPVSFGRTEINKVYLFKILFKEIDQYTKTEAVISTGNIMEYKYEFPEKYLQFIFKGTFEKGERVVNKVKWTKIFPK